MGGRGGIEFGATSTHGIQTHWWRPGPYVWIYKWNFEWKPKKTIPGVKRRRRVCALCALYRPKLASHSWDETGTWHTLCTHSRACAVVRDPA